MECRNCGYEPTEVEAQRGSCPRCFTARAAERDDLTEAPSLGERSAIRAAVAAALAADEARLAAQRAGDEWNHAERERRKAERALDGAVGHEAYTEAMRLLQEAVGRAAAANRAFAEAAEKTSSTSRAARDADRLLRTLRAKTP